MGSLARRVYSQVKVFVKFGLNRFRFRSPERNREVAERRFTHINRVVRSAIAEAEAEYRGLRGRIVKARGSVMSLLGHVEHSETDAACRAQLADIEHRLIAGERSLAQLEDHLAALRKVGRRLDRLIDEA